MNWVEYCLCRGNLEMTSNPGQAIIIHPQELLTALHRGDFLKEERIYPYFVVCYWSCKTTLSWVIKVSANQIICKFLICLKSWFHNNVYTRKALYFRVQKTADVLINNLFHETALHLVIRVFRLFTSLGPKANRCDIVCCPWHRPDNFSQTCSFTRFKRSEGPYNTVGLS